MMSFLVLLVSFLVTVAYGIPSHPLFRAAATSGRASVGLQRNPHFRPNGPAQLVRAHMRYGVPLPDHLAKFAPGVSLQSPGGNVSAWNQTSDREYLSPILIGSPGQVVMLDFDTGSADLWLFSPETNIPFSSTPDTRRVYSPSKSSSASPVNGSSWTILYGDGSYASGNVWKDTIQLGGLTLGGLVVETAISVSASMVEDPSISGLLGLAWNHSSTVVPPAPNTLDALESVLDEKLFSVDLRYHDVGNYDFGGVDNTRYTGNISYQPLIKPSEFWQFFMQSVNIGSNDTWLIHDWQVVADTGTSLMLLPNDIVDTYWATVPGAIFSIEDGGYIFPCNETTGLPSFSMGFNDDLVVTVPGHYMNFESVDPVMCYGGIQYGLGLPFSILGDVFLKSCFVVFDFGNEQLGIAKKTLLA